MSARVLVIGRSGQVATELQRATLPSGVVLEAWGRERLDLAQTREIAGKLAQFQPDVVINAAAFTGVDLAETHAEEAFALNRDGPAALARACADLGAALVHLSTDYVFDGASSRPYVETDPKAPLSVYGRSKSEGEDAVLAHLPDAIILRSSWVYASHGANFVRTMLRLAETRDEIGVVSDQIGRPTWARDLADCVKSLALRAAERDANARGIFHYAAADDATWADFAEAIFAEAGARGAKTARVKRITTAEFPTAATRPANSRLDTSKIAALGISPQPWRERLARCLDEPLR